MSRSTTNIESLDTDEEEMRVELIGVLDLSGEAEVKFDRVTKLVAKIVLLGQTKGRPRKENSIEEQIAA